MTRKLTIFVFAAFVFSSISIIIAHRSNCRVEEYRVQKEFDPQKFAGRWYAYKYLPSSRFPSPLSYQDLVFTFILSDNRTYSTYTTSRENSWSNCTNVEGKMYIPFAGTNMSAKMEFQMDRSSANKVSFWVLETDYTGYAVIYGCLTAVNQTTGFCPQNEVNAWALARFVWEPPSDYAIWRIDHRLDYFCSNVSHYEMVVHNKERCRFPESMFWLPQPAFNISKKPTTKTTKLNTVIEFSLVNQTLSKYNKFMGNWYEQEYIPLDAYRVPRAETDQNVLISLQLRENGTIDLSRSARKAMNNSRCFNESRYLETTDIPGKFIFKVEADSEGFDFTVVFTDYTFFTFVVGCLDKPVDKNRPCQKYHSWVGTRYVNASGHCGLWLQRLMALHDIDDRLYYPTIQNHTCDYVPPPLPPPPPPPSATTLAPPTCAEKATGGAPRDMSETLTLVTAAIMTLVWKVM